MIVVKTDIIPKYASLLGVKDTLDYKAICVFAALGFFLDKDTYYMGLQATPPASLLEEERNSRPWFQWHYTPRDITLKQATEEFAHLFEHITSEQIGDQKVILPLSGGLDSRTQAAALRGCQNVFSFSYEFPNGIPETKYGRAIAKVMGFEFRDFTIPRGYLWDKIDQLAELNGCSSEFTHPRQMAFFEEYTAMGDLFFLGHWGDVLFDDMGVPDELPFEAQVEVVFKKITEKGGLELAESLWQAWGLDGDFSEYLRSRIEKLLAQINIDNANARIRAFKSLYWAPRWTSTNLSVFSAARPIALPYYHDEMCKFICTVPESHLAGRQIQIEYLKMVAPELARIPWQAQRPFNLYTYPRNKMPWNLPYRVWNKTKNTLKAALGRPLRQRNWELQFLGKENDRNLREHLFQNETFSELVPAEMVERFYARFKTEDSVYCSHAVSMLLTLSVFSRKFWKANAN